MTNQQNQKTAIRQLIEKLDSMVKDESLSLDYRASLVVAMQKAKSLEPVNEQQIKDAWDKAKESNLSSNGEIAFKTGEKYFNETYEKPCG